VVVLSYHLPYYTSISGLNPPPVNHHHFEEKMQRYLDVESGLARAQASLRTSRKQ
jgi:hypothetical protein